MQLTIYGEVASEDQIFGKKRENEKKKRREEKRALEAAEEQKRKSSEEAKAKELALSNEMRAAQQ